MSALLAQVFVALIVGVLLWDGYRRYFQKTELLIAKVLDKTSAGMLSRRMYFLVIEVQGQGLQYETTEAIWNRVSSGQVVRLAVTGSKFIRSLDIINESQPNQERNS